MVAYVLHQAVVPAGHLTVPQACALGTMLTHDCSPYAGALSGRFHVSGVLQHSWLLHRGEGISLVPGVEREHRKSSVGGSEEWNVGTEVMD